MSEADEVKAWLDNPANWATEADVDALNEELKQGRVLCIPPLPEGMEFAPLRRKRAVDARSEDDGAT